MRILAFFLVFALPLAAIASLGADPVAGYIGALGWHDQAAWLARDPVLKGQELYAAQRWDEAAAAFRDAGAGASYNLGNALSRAGQLAEALKAYDVALDRNADDEDAAFNRALVADLIKMQEAVPPGTTEGGANSVAKTKRKDQATDDDRDSADLTGVGDGHASGKEAESKRGTLGGSQVSKTGTNGKSTLDSGQGQARGSAGDAEGTGRRGGSLTSATEQWMMRQRFVSRKSWEEQSVQPTRQWLDAIPDDPGKFLKLRLAAERARRLEAAALVKGAR